MPRSKVSDLFGVLKGVQDVTNPLIKHQEDAIRYRITHSSLKDLPEKWLQAVRKKLNNTEPSKVPIMKDLKDIVERINAIEEDIKQYIKVTASQTLDIKYNSYTLKKETKQYMYDTAKDPKEMPIDGDVILPKYDTSKSTTQKSLEGIQNNATRKYMSVKEKIETITNIDKEIPDIEFFDKDKELLRKLELEHEKNIKNKVASSACPSTIKAHEEGIKVHVSIVQSDESIQKHI